MRAWRHRGTCANPGAPDAWVRSISRREALRIVGRPRAAPAPPAADEPASAPPAPAPVDVRRAMRLLDELDQRLVLRFYWAGQADHEIARDLRMPLGTVKVRLHRARLRLHDALGAGFSPRRLTARAQCAWCSCTTACPLPRLISQRLTGYANAPAMRSAAVSAA